MLSGPCPWCETGQVIVQEIHTAVQRLTLRCTACGHIQPLIRYGAEPTADTSRHDR
ncbi:MAG: hypothetical protein QM736_14130 [Vicinamibacterales bacterium]